VRLTSPRLAAPLTLTPQPGDRPGEIKVHLPTIAEDATAMSAYAPGFYTLAVKVAAGAGPALISNELAFALAPTITVTPGSAPAGTVHISTACTPRIAEGQRILLMLADRQAEPDPPPDPAPPPDPSQRSATAFTLDNVRKNADGSARTCVVRLRVDGVDSIPVVYDDATGVPAFDTQQQVKIT